MWGNILTDLNYNTNFNLQFPNSKTDILIHLAQWQYWWWFWFSSLWGMYYLFLAKTLRNRTLKFRPKIASTFRPHGKWGDMIICILPLSWCLNILVSSNYLLKVLEWQAESSLFTIRVRGKQWYWVYKFDFRNFTDIISAPRNVGRNKWTYSFCGEIQTSSNYYHLMQLRSQSKFIKKFWGSNLDNFTEEASSNNIALIESYLRGTRKLNQSKKNKKLNYEFLCGNEDYYSIINFLTDLKKRVIETRKSANKQLIVEKSIKTETPETVVSKKYEIKLLNKKKIQLLDKNIISLEARLKKSLQSKLLEKNPQPKLPEKNLQPKLPEPIQYYETCSIFKHPSFEDLQDMYKEPNKTFNMDKFVVCKVSCTEDSTESLSHEESSKNDITESLAHEELSKNNITESFVDRRAKVFKNRLFRNLMSRHLENAESLAHTRAKVLKNPLFRNFISGHSKKKPGMMLWYEEDLKEELKEWIKLMDMIKRSEEIIKRPIKNIEFINKRILKSKEMVAFKDIGKFRKERILAHPLLLKKEKKLLCLINGDAMSTWINPKYYIVELGPDETFKQKVSFLKSGLGLAYFQVFDKKLPYSISSCMSREDSFKDIKNQMGKKNPIHLVKNQINNDFIKTYKDNYMLRFKFHDRNALLEDKTATKPMYFCFKQKRYKVRNQVTEIYSDYNYKNHKKKPLSFTGNHVLKNNYNIESETKITNKAKGSSKKTNLKMIQDLRKKYQLINNTEGSNRLQRLIKKSKARSENFNVTLSKRLLRVKKTLVIPTHVNITAITNSYDVVHSWFIPGLGLKMDCVPGRSTHHTFYVDNAGFYYGQCAEICGRYHHHMPIRVCALPFEHFLLWWNNFGLPHLMRTGKKDFIKEYSFRKYSW